MERSIAKYCRLKESLNPRYISFPHSPSPTGIERIRRMAADANATGFLPQINAYA